MQWRVDGADRKTGENVSITVSASNQDDAEHLASAQEKRP